MHRETPNSSLDYTFKMRSCNLSDFEDCAKQKRQWHNEYCAEAVSVSRVQSISVFLSDYTMNSNPSGCVMYYYWLVNGNAYADSPSYGYTQEKHLSQENAASATDSSEKAKKRKLPPAAKNEKYKTKMCRNYSQTGKCKYGRMCQYAHGKAELKKYSL